MQSIFVDIKPEVLQWAISQTEVERLDEKLKEDISQWLMGTKVPTFKQISNFSKKSNIPLGYFFLNKPPEEKIELLEYRTIDSVELDNPSRNLIDIVHEMQNVQEWMKQYREEWGYNKLSYVGSMKGVADIDYFAEKIRNDLELKINWYEECNSIEKAFKYIRSLLEENGVLVMMNGIVGKNTHRVLNLNEFRAFALVDNLAPLIFINSVDSNGAKLFSLFHEIAHIWIGEDDLFNDKYYNGKGVSNTEIICNAVAGELMVPTNLFLEYWDKQIYQFDDDVNVKSVISDAAKFFKCGNSVVARKALDNGKIERAVYEEVIQNAIDSYNNMKDSKQSSGGNYYNTMASRLDRCLVKALCESINMGRTSYTEAYRLTNTSRKTFADVVEKFGGIG